MKSQTYMDRALRSRDPRYADVLDRLGYGRRDMQARPSDPADDVTALRAEYQRVVGKRPFMGWDGAKLRAKIADAMEGSDG